jgi:hypothetical protein
MESVDAKGTSGDPSKGDYVWQLGLYYLSINNVDLTPGYISKKKALELNLPHFQILEIHER